MMAIVDLPADLLSNIFLRLPVKTLIRSMLVCKSLFALISSPCFIIRHLNRSSGNDLLLMQSWSHDLIVINRASIKLAKFKTQHASEFSNVHVLGSFNGICCLHATNAEKGYDYVYLCNPILGICKSLDHQILINYRFRVCLGFGYHSQTCDYKVVRFTYEPNRCSKPQESGTQGTEVYSLSMNSWRRIKDSPPACHLIRYKSEACVNGVLHWLSRSKGSGNFLYDSVISFDMGDEVFREIMLPAEYPWQNKSLFTCKELLALYGKVRAKNCSQLWVMKEYGVRESWTKLYTIDMEQKVYGCLGISENGELMLRTVVEDQILCVDSKGMKKNASIRIDSPPDVIFNFRESLLLLDQRKLPQGRANIAHLV